VPIASSISNFISGIAAQGGMSMSNGYDVEFKFGAGTSELTKFFKDTGKRGLGIDPDTGTPSNGGYLLKVLCDEAQLPNVQAATGQINGRLLGEGTVYYPHTRLYSDFTLSWMCDSNMIPLKFLTVWHSYIFSADRPGFTPDPDSSYSNLPKFVNGKTLDNLKSEAARNPSRNVRLKFPSSYQCNVQITKTERSANAPNGRASATYILEDCFPYSIDAVPLSYGASQITKVSANFYYAKQSVIFNNIPVSFTG